MFFVKLAVAKLATFRNPLNWMKVFATILLATLLQLNAHFVSAAENSPKASKRGKVQQPINPQDIQPDNLFPRVKLETPYGDIVVELDRNKAPINSNNFLSYVASGRYDATIFHRVVRDFVVQGGGYDILYHAREQQQPVFNESGNGLKNSAYSIAMARENDPHSATNQFYFNMADNESLDPGKNWGYSVFGMVMEGTEVLDLIARAATDTNHELGWDDVPVKQILLKKATILAEQ